jgi:aminoglycoside 3-N-acetyltransferase
MHSRQSLAADCRRLGIRPGDTVMVHASVRAVGAVVGGPDQIHLALKDALTEEGTVMMYAACPQYYDEVGRGHLDAATEAALLEHLPAFDAVTAHSARDNGTLVEFLRTWPDSRVNDHVARFVAWGRHAAALLETQPWDFAYGRGSALERFVELGGRILLLGSDHDTVTFLHYAEHIVDIPDKRVVRYQVPVLDAGVRVWRDMAEVDTGDIAHPHWPDRFFARIVDTWLARTGNAGGLVGDAACHLLDARGLLDFALEVMREVAADAAASQRLVEA